MLTDKQLLLKAICADPDNDLPRLVYADYLEENGQPERAAFIRLQIEFVRMCLAGTGFEDDTLRTELAVLWAARGAAWRAELPRLPGVEWDLFFHRGFAERVVVETDTILRDNAEALLGLNPIHHLCVRRFTGARGVTLLPGLHRLRSATITFELTHVAVDELLAWEGFDPNMGLLLKTAFDGNREAEGRIDRLNTHFRRQLYRDVINPPPPPPPAARRPRPNRGA